MGNILQPPETEYHEEEEALDYPEPAEAAPPVIDAAHVQQLLVSSSQLLSFIALRVLGRDAVSQSRLLEWCTHRRRLCGLPLLAIRGWAQVARPLH